MERTYIAIDLKSFYASVECVERHLDPLTTNLVVADLSRTEKTICLAVSPSLKAHGIGGRARLFEAIQKVKEVNQQRLSYAIRHNLVHKDENGRYSFSSYFSNRQEMTLKAYIAAVSVLKIRFPKEINWKPYLSFNSFTSSSLKPPSGPIITETDLLLTSESISLVSPATFS